MHRLAYACSRHTPTDVWFVSVFRDQSDLSNPALCRENARPCAAMEVG